MEESRGRKVRAGGIRKVREKGKVKGEESKGQGVLEILE